MFYSKVSRTLFLHHCSLTAYTNTQTHKHTNTQTHKHTNTQTHKHTNTPPQGCAVFQEFSRSVCGGSPAPRGGTHPPVRTPPLSRCWPGRPWSDSRSTGSCGRCCPLAALARRPSECWWRCAEEGG